MGQIDKGVVVTLVNTSTARVIPYGPETVSYDVTIPVGLRGYLQKGTPVVYATFADQTGIILGRADGEGASLSSSTISASQVDFTDADLHVRTLEADGEIRGAAVLGLGDVGAYQAPVILATAEEMAAGAAADPEEDGLTVLTEAEAEAMGLFEEDDDP